MARPKVLVSGCYDLLHAGHIRFFETAAQYGDLYVCIGSDDNIRRLKGHNPKFTQEERLYMVQALRHVYAARIGSGVGVLDFEPDLAEIRPDYFVVNADGGSEDKRRLCARHGVQYVELQREPRPGLPARSSTSVKASLAENTGWQEADERTVPPLSPQGRITANHGWALLGSKYMGDYRVIRLREDRYRLERTRTEANFIVCESADWALTIPVTADQQVVLIRQFRHGVRQSVLEVPGGMLDPGESPTSAAARELREETGYEAENVRYVGRLLPNPALNTASCHVVLAENCRCAGSASPDALEQLTVELRPLRQIPHLIRTGELVHAQVIAAFSLWRQFC